ncbi:MAG: rod shape-determining protein MreC [Bacteroidales bacterium]|jgi:rod shape-determining protein MreC|nr:rod shape-determining protein MreC [Bacteroidales bacterium]
MRTLIRFFQRHYLFFIFLVLEGAAFALLVQNHFVQRVAYGNFSGNISNVVNEQISDWNNYLHLRQINEQLIRENTELRNRLPESMYAADAEHSFSVDTVNQVKYQYLSAAVINISVNKQYNYITLNKGAEQNVAKNMAVMGPDGIVGVVVGVSDHFATVLPVINRHFRVSTKFKKNHYYGSLQWDGKSYRHAELNEIPLHVPVETGDTLVISGYSSNFPEGAPVGTVSHFSKKDGNFYDIEVLLFSDFRKLFHVSIVKNYMKLEQDELEQLIKPAAND